MSTNSLSWKDEIGLVTISRTLVECSGDMRHLNEESSSPKNRVLFSQGPTPTHWTPAAPRVQNVVAALTPKAFGGSVQATRNIYLCQSITPSRVRISARGVISELWQITL